MKITVIIADDHHLVRQGIRALLEKTDYIEVVGEAADGQEAFDLTRRLSPDMLLIDIAMPRLNGIETVRRLHAAQSPTQIVILSMHYGEVLVHQALRAGARGFLIKSAVTEELLLAVRTASRGETYLSPAVAEFRLADAAEEPPGLEESSLFERLTPREREVLQLIAEGNTNAGMAQILSVSEKTIEKHRANLMTKLGVHDVASLVRTAIQHGLVFLER